MKKRIRNKVVKKFLAETKIDASYIIVTNFRSARRLVRNLDRQLDELMEYHYRRYCC